MVSGAGDGLNAYTLTQAGLKALLLETGTAITQVIVAFLLLSVPFSTTAFGEEAFRVLVFSKVAEGAYRHESIAKGGEIITLIGDSRGWEVDALIDPAAFTASNLSRYDVVIFNNTAGDLLSRRQQVAFEQYIQAGGGYVGIHTGSDTKYDWPWYDELVGAYFKKHRAESQKADVIVENASHGANKYLIAPGMFENGQYRPGVIAEEWYEFIENPRDLLGATILLAVDENSHSEGKMQSDHPIAWSREYDGGRSFYTTLGHVFPDNLYADPFMISHLVSGIEWAAGPRLVRNSLILDLDAEKGLTLEEANRVVGWKNQIADFAARNFAKRDKGREVPGSGRPTLKQNIAELNGHSSLIFRRQELINMNEDAFDHLTRGSGFTWFAVMTPYTQSEGLKDVNVMFGNLKNGGMYEGIWAGLEDNNRFWMGMRNGVTVGRSDENNLKVTGTVLQENRYYLLAGRMGSGTSRVTVDLFMSEPVALVSQSVQVSEYSNSSVMAVGQERDATNHPGAESFDGELARLLIYERPLNDVEMTRMFKVLRRKYFGEEEQ